jgi:pentose-5-phosphate-3-epimerase
MFAKAGADTIVIGSALFGARDQDGGYRTAIDAFRRELMATTQQRVA